MLKNEGKRPQNTWGITFHAFGRKVSAVPTSDGGWSAQEDSPRGYEAFRGFHQEEPVLVASSVDLMTAPGRNNPIQPHTELNWDFHFFVDRTTADLVTVHVDVVYPPLELHPKPGSSSSLPTRRYQEHRAHGRLPGHARLRSLPHAIQQIDVALDTVGRRALIATR